MSDIFISYTRKDRPLAEWLAESLERDGWHVWWDPKIVPGETFDEKIQESLNAARCVIVIWSKTSVESVFVRAEASKGLERNCLLPISIGELELPVPFNQVQTLDFTGWRGNPAHSAYQDLLRAAQSLLGRAPGLDEAGRTAYPDVDEHRFSIVVARVQHDIGQQLQEVIADDLSEFKGVHVVKINKEIASDGQSPEDQAREAEERAREYLDEMGATVMIWGKILRFANKEVPQLHLTVLRGKNHRRGRYLPTDELRLPRLFWDDLADILYLVVLTYDADFRDQEGTYLGDQLRPFITKVRELLQKSDRERGWGDEAKGLTRISLGRALMLFGGQSGENEPLDEAVETFRKALVELPRERFPQDWARAQNGLGICFWTLGIRRGSIELLHQAVTAYHLALEERIREHAPLRWAQTYNDLGNTLLSLGRLESGTEHLEKAVEAYKTALLERTFEAKRLEWAQTMNNLGVALWELGKREPGTERLQEAAAALKTSLKVYTRHETPLDWSQTQNNLGLVLWTLGYRANDADSLKEAVKAYRAALRERVRGRVPLMWAQTQNNLGLALWSLGDGTNDTRSIQLAVGAFRKALAERTRERSPMDWAQTQNNLGASLWSLGQLKKGTQELEESVQAYRNALSVYSREDMAQEWAQTHHNLGNALTTLGDRKNDTACLEEALKSLRSALGEYNSKQEPMPWAHTQSDLGCTLHLLGEKKRNSKYLKSAVKALEAACPVYQAAEMHEHASAFVQRIENIKSLIQEIGRTDRIQSSGGNSF